MSIDWILVTEADKVSTAWIPLKTISYDELQTNLPEGFVIDQMGTSREYPCLILKYIDPYFNNGEGRKTWIYVWKTKIGGCRFEQFNVNQRHEDIPQLLAKRFNTKCMSYIGEPWDDTDMEKINYHNDLHMREYPDNDKNQ
jgi:hypothetical protein